MSTPEEWWNSLPKVTKIYLAVAVSTTLLVTFGLLSPVWIYLNFDEVIHRFQFWRLLTNFAFFGKFSFPWIFQIVLLVRYMGMLETEVFHGSSGRADFLFMLGFGASCLTFLAYHLGMVFLGPSLVFMVLYVWSRRDPHRDVIFYGFRLKAWHFPFVMLVFGMLLGGSPVGDLAGIFVGHLYHFLLNVVEPRYRLRVIKTPGFLYRMCGADEVADAQDRAFRNPNMPAQGGHRLG